MASDDEVAGWLEGEIERVWLLAEARLRALEERGGLAPGDPGRADLDRILVARRPARDLAAQTEAVMAARPLVPLGRLAARLGLRALEIEALIVALAPHLDETLDCAFTHLQNNYNRRGVDLALVAELLDLERADRVSLLEVLDVDRPLIALRLLEAEPGPGRSAMFRHIAPALDALPVLTGRRRVSPKLALAAELIDGASDESFWAGDQLATMVARSEAAAAQLTGDDPPWLLLWGPCGVGKRELAARIATGAGKPLLAFDPERVRGGDGDEQLRRGKREALLNDAVLYVGPCLGELAADGARELAARFASYPGPLILGFETATAPGFVASHAVVEIALEPPDHEVRLELWSRAVPEDRRSPGLDVAAVAAAYRLTGGEIASLARDLASSPSAIGEAELRAAIERRLRTELAGLAQRVPSRARAEDLVLPDDQLERVHQLIERRRHSERVFGDWGLGRRVSRGRGVIGLFSGPPGTGKTMLAEVIAGDLGLELYKVDLSQVVSKWVGETEKQLARIFELAERAHVVLLFDEADALLARRTQVQGANDRYGNLAVNYLLQRFEDYEGVVILTTNAASSLDRAVARRLTCHLRLDEPEQDERLRLWRSMLPDALPVAAELGLDRLAGDFEMTGGHIKNAVVRAAFLAAAAGTPVDAELLRRAAKQELNDMGRIA
jgi:AAA+ superfamily predicted ATPase